MGPEQQRGKPIENRPDDAGSELQRPQREDVAPPALRSNDWSALTTPQAPEYNLSTPRTIAHSVPLAPSTSPFSLKATAEIFQHGFFRSFPIWSFPVSCTAGLISFSFALNALYDLAHGHLQGSLANACVSLVSGAISYGLWSFAKYCLVRFKNASS